MEEYITKNGRQLRLGYTTGTCAAAAAKAAAWMLLSGQRKERIKLLTPKGIELELDVLDIEMSEGYVTCSIEKDSGDDPDVTKGTHIFATVSYCDSPNAHTPFYGQQLCDGRNGKSFKLYAQDNPNRENIIIEGGEGVGRVTKRGLDQPVGAAAINSVPRRMIRENIEEVLELMDYGGTLSVIISVPGGEELAEKTFNPRLGIIGGISILGTTGIVEPMSEQSLVDTIRVELNQRKAEGAEYVLLTPGNYGSEYISGTIGMDPESAVMVSNYIGDALEICMELGFKGALLVGHAGKLVKIAGGMFNTHSKYGDCRMEIMAAHAGAAGLENQYIDEILECATCDDAIRVLKEASAKEGRDFTGEVLKRLQAKIAFMMDNKVHGMLMTGAVLVSREYGFLCSTEHADELLSHVIHFS